MWIEVSKLFLCFYFSSAVATAYYNKQDYIKQSEKKYMLTSSSSSSKYDSSKVRQPRFKKIDEVKRRIDNMNADDGYASSKLSYSRLRHKGLSRSRPSTSTTTTTTTTSDEGLFDTYGDLENEYDLEEYDDSLEDEEDELDYEDEYTENPVFESIEDEDYNSFQAEEPTERPTVAPKPYSSLSRLKWDTLGTRAGVEKSRRDELKKRGGNRETEVLSAVFAHINRVNQEGRCQKPLRKVIQVQKEHPDPSKVYTPFCTLLHRCAEDSGCCKFGHTCQYKSRKLVNLYVRTEMLGTGYKTIEVLSFYNHTECECKEKTNTTSTESRLDESSGSSFKFSKPINTENNLDNSSGRLSYRSAGIFPGTSQNLKRCKKCPGQFQRKPRYDNKCFCDCEEGNLDCIHMKKGKEHFSLTDRLCISERECGLPVCEYGTYIKEQGKCPSRKEKIEVFRRINSY